MKVILDVNRAHAETTIHITCNEVNESINEILDFLNERKAEFIIGNKGDQQHILKPTDVHHFRSEGDTVLAATSDGVFKVKEKLYELEQILSSKRFIRLSKSVIANLYEISHFELSFNSTLCVHFKSGGKEYASSHYVTNIKETLNMNRREKK